MSKDIRLPNTLQSVLSKLDVEKIKTEIELAAFRREFSKIEAACLNKFNKIEGEFKGEISSYCEEHKLDPSLYGIYKLEDGFYIGLTNKGEEAGGQELEEVRKGSIITNTFTKLFKKVRSLRN